MNQIKQKWSWAKQNPLFWGNLLILAASLAVIWLWPAPDASDFRVRLLGMVLQLVGILTVWHDLTAAARHFGKGGPLSFFVSTWEWLKAGIFGPPTISLGGSASVGLDVITGRGGARQPVKPDAALAVRVAALEANLAQIDADLDRALKEIDERTSELKTEISAEAAAREHSINDVKRSLENTATGNYAPLAFGAFWLAVGVVVATLAPEIALAAAGRWGELWAKI